MHQHPSCISYEEQTWIKKNIPFELVNRKFSSSSCIFLLFFTNYALRYFLKLRIFIFEENSYLVMKRCVRAMCAYYKTALVLIHRERISLNHSYSRKSAHEIMYAHNLIFKSMDIQTNTNKSMWLNSEFRVREIYFLHKLYYAFFLIPKHLIHTWGSSSVILNRNVQHTVSIHMSIQSIPSIPSKIHQTYQIETIISIINVPTHVNSSLAPSMFE